MKRRLYVSNWAICQVNGYLSGHYEKGILFQMKLIKTGYRYYSAHQIPLLKQILLLRDSGFKVEEMAETLKT